MQVLAGFFFAAALATAGPDAFTWLQTIPLPGVQGRIDHLDADTAGRRLFVAALGNGTLEVIDLAQSKVVRSLTGLDEPQGVAYVSKGNRLFVACGGDGSVKIFDGLSFRLIRSVDLGSDADNVRYAEGENRIYVGFGSGGIAVLDPDSGAVLARIALPAHPESFQLEAQGNRIFVNVPGANGIEVLDRIKRKVIAHWAAGLLRSNFPMALDASGHRLFVGVRWPARLRVFDTGSGAQLSEIPIGGDVDDVFLDPAWHRVLASCGGGELDLLDVADAEHPRILERMRTAPGARTGLFLAREGKLYLAVPAKGERKAELRVYGVRPELRG